MPVGLALVLIGFLVLLTRRSALSQLIGFVILDNGIATTAFLTSGGVPLVVELGVTLDVLLVVLILRVLDRPDAVRARRHRPRRPDGVARLMTALIWIPLLVPLLTALAAWWRPAAALDPRR